MPRVSKFSGVLTAGQFAELTTKLGLAKSKSLKAARAVMVDGLTCEAAGDEYGVSRQRVNAYCGNVFDAFVPPAWKSGFIALPPDLMKQVRELERKARDAWEASNALNMGNQ